MADDEKRVRDEGDEAPDAPLDVAAPGGGFAEPAEIGPGGSANVAGTDEQVEAGRAGRGADGDTAARADQERRGGP